MRMLVPPKPGDPIREVDTAMQIGTVLGVKKAGDDELIVTLDLGLEGAAGRSATRLEPVGGSDAGGSTPPPSAEPEKA